MAVSSEERAGTRLWCLCCVCGAANGKRQVLEGERRAENDENLSNENGTVIIEIQPPPDHLVIMVNGIIGSADDWKFAAELFRKRLRHNVVVHCSTCNSSAATFHGVDTMGTRLANEVEKVVKDTPGLRKISFLGHSLGGLVARYAIAKLYKSHQESQVGNDTQVNENSEVEDDHMKDTIAGLQPINFITVATPHLGSRGNQQLPFLGGIQVLEKTAQFLAHWFVGQTGKHLFLSDGNKSRLPLLQRMVTDCEEGKFLSSLRAFKTRTVYANVINDHVVGWRTSSLRRKSEMPKIDHKPVSEKYPHIVYEEEPTSKIIAAEKATVSKGDPIEEGMLAQLEMLHWRRYDVSFLGAKAASQAHNTIQVKNAKVHSEGEDVIEHIIDKHFLK